MSAFGRRGSAQGPGAESGAGARRFGHPDPEPARHVGPRAWAIDGSGRVAVAALTVPYTDSCQAA
ncbi:hypothetical protein ACFXAZ_18150 [Streptomyces sp. NPDC059477]|uniref:hypothetical protein n=1 Tax=Streptomyces sp. NPDC059477 TaxID=3346847 RepID=UPI0036990328